MGMGRWTDADWKRYADRSIKGKATVKDIYTASAMDPSLDPKGTAFRESVDSADNPQSTPIIVGLDVTGSMGFILDNMAREGLKNLAGMIYERKPVTDPHLMFMGIGDVCCDRAPLQVTQFEADIRIAEQLTRLYLEQGGGGNDNESYTLPWWFAAMHTKCDNYLKRHKKGYLFTIGDECPPDRVTAEQIERVFGYRPQFEDISSEAMLDLVSRQYEVFHIIAEEGHFCKRHQETVVMRWRKLLGERALLLSDHTKMAELIVSTLQILSGGKPEEVAGSFDPESASVIGRAVGGLTVRKEDGIVVRF